MQKMIRIFSCLFLMCAVAAPTYAKQKCDKEMPEKCNETCKALREINQKECERINWKFKGEGLQPNGGGANPNPNPNPNPGPTQPPIGSTGR
jgi:hypothetical protein